MWVAQLKLLAIECDPYISALATATPLTVSLNSSNIHAATNWFSLHSTNLPVYILAFVTTTTKLRMVKLFTTSLSLFGFCHSVCLWLTITLVVIGAFNSLAETSATPWDGPHSSDLEQAEKFTHQVIILLPSSTFIQAIISAVSRSTDFQLITVYINCWRQAAVSITL